MSIAIVISPISKMRSEGLYSVPVAHTCYAKEVDRFLRTLKHLKVTIGVKPDGSCEKVTVLSPFPDKVKKCMERDLFKKNFKKLPIRK